MVRVGGVRGSAPLPPPPPRPRGWGRTGTGAAEGLALRGGARAPRPASGTTVAAIEGGVGAKVDGEEIEELSFDNNVAEGATVARLVLGSAAGEDVLARVCYALADCGLSVSEAKSTGEDGTGAYTFFMVDEQGGVVDPQEWEMLQMHVRASLKASAVEGEAGPMSSARPLIYGSAAMAELARLRPKLEAKTGAVVADASSKVNVEMAEFRSEQALRLEVAAAELAVAAAEVTAAERKLGALANKWINLERQGRLMPHPELGNDQEVLEIRARMTKELQAEEEERDAAASRLQRKVAAFEAALADKSSASMVLERMIKPLRLSDVKRPAVEELTPTIFANGDEVLLQSFDWESCKSGTFYKNLGERAKQLAEWGISSAWLPPPTDSVSDQGYLPRDLYTLDSKYGTELELRECLKQLKAANIKPVADIVINHRCAAFQDEEGRWNKFGGESGKLSWDKSAITRDGKWGGTGGKSTGEEYEAAPNIDHSNEQIRKDLKEWLMWLKDDIGFVGWRLDFVKGFAGRYFQEYVESSKVEISFGELWDACAYENGVLAYNQDNHRRQLCNWVSSTGVKVGAFDFTTKGILQEACGKNEYWRLRDGNRKPPGMIGFWPSCAVTFIDNHDTASTLQHWPFPTSKYLEGYAYILTHPGTPTVFIDNLNDRNLQEKIVALVQLRKRNGVHSRSAVAIQQARNDVYAAWIGDDVRGTGDDIPGCGVDVRMDKPSICMKIGPGDWSPNQAGVGGKRWEVTTHGPGYAVWEEMV